MPETALTPQTLAVDNNHITEVFHLSREQADEQYNPTLWTRRLPKDDLLPAHIELTQLSSETYRVGLGDHLSLTNFGEGETAGTMDVYRPANVSDDAPIVVYIHGGWWQWFSKEQFGYIAKPFNEQGYAVVMPGYRLAQEWDNGAPMESILAQMESAVGAVLEDAVQRGAPAVHLIGHSAGGHLAAMLHRTDWAELGVSEAAQDKLRSVFSLAGLFDVRPLVRSYVNEAIGMSTKSAERVSPLLLPVPEGAQRCPLHLILPEYDTPEFFQQTKAYQEELLRVGQECRLRVVADRDHLDLIERLGSEDDELTSYLLEHMARAEVLHTSRRWIASFNRGDINACARGYAKDAELCAKPIGTIQGRDQVEAFWRDFVNETGATNLVYDNVRLEVDAPTRVRLAADWNMNVGRGIITKELWVRQSDGAWRLEEDHFEIQERW